MGECGLSPRAQAIEQSYRRGWMKAKTELTSLEYAIAIPHVMIKPLLRRIQLELNRLALFIENPVEIVEPPYLANELI